MDDAYNNNNYYYYYVTPLHKRSPATTKNHDASKNANYSPVRARLGRVLTGRLTQAGQSEIRDDSPVVSIQQYVVRLQIPVENAQLRTQRHSKSAQDSHETVACKAHVGRSRSQERCFSFFTGQLQATFLTHGGAELVAQELPITPQDQTMQPGLALLHRPKAWEGEGALAFTNRCGRAGTHGRVSSLTSWRYSMPSTTSFTILTRPADRSGCGRCLSSSPPPPFPPVSRSRSPRVPFARKSYTRETWCGEATHTPRKPQTLGCRSLRTMCCFLFCVFVFR